MPTLKKLLTCLAIWFKKICCRLTLQNGPWNLDNRLRCYEITTMSLVAAFYWNTINMQKMQQIWTVCCNIRWLCCCVPGCVMIWFCVVISGGWWRWWESTTCLWWTWYPSHQGWIQDEHSTSAAPCSQQILWLIHRSLRLTSVYNLPNALAALDRLYNQFVCLSVSEWVSEWVCHTKRVERSTDRNLPPIFTKLATKVAVSYTHLTLPTIYSV